MRLILSRKGFDSASGGYPSPIFPDGRLLSLPIPDVDSNIRYGDLKWQGVNVGNLISELTGSKQWNTQRAHLDPDLDRRMIQRKRGWRALLGQTHAAQGHLRNQGVRLGDLFLFFGLFLPVEQSKNRWQYVRGAQKQHLIWGWLQIGEIHSVNEISQSDLPWARYHPHFLGDRGPSNTLYVASRKLNLQDDDSLDIKGSGVFSGIHSARTLTAPESLTPSLWRLPSFLFPKEGKPALSYHSNVSRWQEVDDEYCCLRSAARGQEFVLDSSYYGESLTWLKSLFHDVERVR